MEPPDQDAMARDLIDRSIIFPSDFDISIKIRPTYSAGACPRNRTSRLVSACLDGSFAGAHRRKSFGSEIFG
jgi:hypothetical protein